MRAAGGGKRWGRAHAGRFADYAGSAALFHDPYRLHRDILADSATAYLNELFGHSTAAGGPQ